MDPASRHATVASGVDPGSAPSGLGAARQAALWLGITGGIGLLLFLYRHLGALTAGGHSHAAPLLIDELVAAFGGGLLFLPVLTLTRRFPLNGPDRMWRLPLYAAALLAFSALHTSSNWALRSVLYPLFDLGHYDYGRMPLRYLMELPIDTIVFTFMVAAIHAVGRIRRSRERQLRAAQLESRLVQTQMRNLRLQLQPHFLFNSLNTISATLYDEPARADQMIEHLAALLRGSLGSAEQDEVPLRVELELLDSYVAIVRARFGDRLGWCVDVDEGLEECAVPPLLIQPLVENAIRHGGVERRGTGSVAVRIEAVRQAPAPNQLRITVTDDGPGLADGADPLGDGLGLSATAERMQLLYGRAQTFDAGNRPAGGFSVRLVLPLRFLGESR